MKYYESVLSNYQIFCDMDGVLCDFVEGGNDLGFGSNEFDEDYFWDAVANTRGKFWEELEWTNDGYLLWDYLLNFDPKIITTPASTDIYCRIGKIKWVEKELGDVDVLFSHEMEDGSHSKGYYADENSILIDDMVYNIEDWEENGGVGILYKSAGDTILQLKKLGL